MPTVLYYVIRPTFSITFVKVLTATFKKSTYNYKLPNAQCGAPKSTFTSSWSFIVNRVNCKANTFVTNVLESVSIIANGRNSVLACIGRLCHKTYIVQQNTNILYNTDGVLDCLLNPRNQ